MPASPRWNSTTRAWLEKPVSARWSRSLAAEVWVTDPASEHVLLVKHRVRGWVPPGGKVEPGEAPRVAAARELLEETGLRAALLEEPAAVQCGPTEPTGLPPWAGTAGDERRDPPPQPPHHYRRPERRPDPRPHRTHRRDLRVRQHRRHHHTLLQQGYAERSSPAVPPRRMRPAVRPDNLRLQGGTGPGAGRSRGQRYRCRPTGPQGTVDAGQVDSIDAYAAATGSTLAKGTRGVDGRNRLPDVARFVVEPSRRGYDGRRRPTALVADTCTAVA